VVDQGVGIPHEDIPHVFEAFRRGSNVEDIRGTGLGLLGVMQTVQQHGGTITINTSTDTGTTINVALPISPGSSTGGARR
jgi:signal transduction histidine kinase